MFPWIVFLYLLAMLWAHPVTTLCGLVLLVILAWLYLRFAEWMLR